jgi:hypothetical protein
MNTLGVSDENVPPTLAQLHQTGMVSNFLVNLTDAFVQLLQLVPAIHERRGSGVDHRGQSTADWPSRRDDIQGKFNLELSFDPRDLDMDLVEANCRR